MFGKIKHFHFVGIGGVGMSGIAEVLLNLGYKVSGSDLNLTEITERLQALGAVIHQGHAPEYVEGADVVIYSAAVKSDNPEIQTALERKIPVVSRAEMLSELMRTKYGIAIAGTHGKTTTASMIGMVLTAGGYDPTIIVGGRVKSLKTTGKLGQGDFLVAEADEFDRSFLKLTPTLAVITTLESEHLDCYHNLEEIKSAFVEFANKVPFYGAVIMCGDEEPVRAIMPRIKRRIITYGLASGADFQAVNLSFKEDHSRFEAIHNEEKLGALQLHQPGVHNVKNALAAVAVGTEIEIPFFKTKKALEEFTGVHRRFEIKAELDGIMVVDDYAHHPTEIKATLSAARQGWNRRIVAVFQPHLYTRTRDFDMEFGRSFLLSDILVVADVYAAREEPIAGVSGELVARAALSFGHKKVHYVADKAQIADFLLQIVEAGDMVLTLGAGDIWKVGEEFVKKLKAGAKRKHP